MSKFQYDKKQLPQVIVLGVLAAGTFGYFGVKLLVPPQTEAAPGKAATAAGSGAAGAASAALTGSQQVASASMQDAPPASSMRDPFIAPVNGVDPNATPVAALPKPAPLPAVVKSERVSALPPPPSFAPLMPVPISTPKFVAPGHPTQMARGPQSPLGLPSAQVNAAPAWTVTGVLGSGGDPANCVAIMRLGDQRRFVRPGSTVDGVYKVVSITREGVTLSRDGKTFHIMLGSPSAPKHVPTPNGVPGLPGGVSTPDGGMPIVPTNAPAVSSRGRAVPIRVGAGPASVRSLSA